MSKWVWCGVAGFALVGAGLYLVGANSPPQSWLGRIVHLIPGTSAKPADGSDKVVAAASAPVMPNPEHPPTPKVQPIVASEPIVVELPGMDPVEHAPDVPTEILEFLAAPRSEDEREVTVPFMPPALADFGAPVRRMPYADEEEAPLPFNYIEAARTVSISLAFMMW